MKKIITLTALVLAAFALHAQFPVTGKITDEKQKPVKGANVLLLKQKDSSLVLSAISDADGHYKFPEVKDGQYAVSVSMIGYARVFERISVAGKEVAVPETKLQPQAVSLGNVTVTS